MVQRKKKPGPAEKPWSQRLKELRTRLDLTQAQAAEKAGIPLRTWISWENNQRKPARFTQDHLKRVFPDL